ncbi:MAG: hypothetical protein P4L69_19310 [Desulfosporosinus sp.]|nr:hypothetical protein [Desulfosporosinus sp.]
MSGLTIKRYSPKSTGDNCLIMCFHKFYNQKGNVLKSDKIRVDLKLPKGPIDIKYIPKLSEYYNKITNTKKGYILTDPTLNLITTSSELELTIPLFKLVMEEEDIIDNNIILQLEDKHYYLIQMEVEEMKQCPDCGTKYKKVHNCNINKQSWYQTKTLKKRNMVKVKKLKKEDKIEGKEIVFWDLETFQPNNVQTVYASGYTLDDKYTVHYGKDSMDSTVDDFLQLDGKRSPLITEVDSITTS